jgi:Mce-associated membrane protein
LTDIGDTTKDTAASRADETAATEKRASTRGAVPVGKRGGRHRYFRPRPVAAAPASADTTVEAAPDAETLEAEIPTVTETVEAEAPVTEDSTEVTPEDAPKLKRRGWFRRHSAAASDVTADGTAEEPDGTAEAADWPEAETRDRKPAGRRMAIAVAVGAALFVAAGAFGGAMLQPYLADRAVANTKLDIARTATDAITTLFTYTPEDMDQLPARSSKYLGGDLRDQYTKQVDALAATNKQNQIHRSAQVVGTAVEALNGPNATAVVYANVTYTSAASRDVPKIFLVSYRLTMQRKGSDWVITNMPWITSKDLTRVTP